MQKAVIDSSFLVCGHRGYAAKYPENTLISYEEAVKTGVAMVEIDIGISADGVLMLCHDGTLDRTSDGKGPVSSYSYGELKRFNMAALFPGLPAQRMMTLEECLIWIRQYPGLMLNIDLKHYGADVARQAAELTDSYGLTGRTVFNGLNGEGLAMIHKLGLFTEGSPEGKYGMENFDALWDGGKIMMDAVCIYWKDISPEYVKTLKSLYGEDIAIWSFGIDTDFSVRLAYENGISLVLANDPFPALAFKKKHNL